MEIKKKNICVYCSSSFNLPEKYYKFAEKFGALIPKNGYNMVYGGSTCGMMSVIAESALKNGAEVIGVISEKIASFGVTHPDLTKVIVTKDMRERKARMEENADVFVAMPGGFGTFDEVFEILVLKQLGYHSKPVIFVNFDGYYDNLIKMFEKMYDDCFAIEQVKDSYLVVNDLDEIFDYITNYQKYVAVLKG